MIAHNCEEKEQGEQVESDRGRGDRLLENFDV